MSERAVAVVLVAGWLAVGLAQTDSLVMPLVVGQDLYQVSKTLRRMGLELEFEQVEVDTALVPEFFVAGQVPDSGASVAMGDEVLVRFNCPGVLRYWDEWVVPLLGDFRNQVGFYQVEKPAEPIHLPGAGYPEELRKYQFSGEALVEALVDFDGTVLAARAVESSGYHEADSAACEAVLRGRFSGAEHHGQSVRVWFPVPYEWEHEEGPELPGPGQEAEPSGP